MNRPYNIFILFLLLLTSLLISCKPGVPKKYLSPSKMEAILYDYQLAQSVAKFDANFEDTLRSQVYKLAALKKHGITEAEFDSSMVYYTRHSDRLRTIYDNLSKRLSDEAIAYGASQSELNQLKTISATGDTANVWKGDQSFILSQQPGFNVYSFAFDADTTFRKGDQFILTFNTRFIFQDGMRDAIALVALTFTNDSTASQILRLSVDNTFRIDISDDRRLGVKRVTGYFLLNRNTNKESLTTLKLLYVNQLALLRIHTKEPEQKDDESDDEQQPDSLPRLAPDSLPRLNPDSLPRIKKNIKA